MGDPATYCKLSSRRRCLLADDDGDNDDDDDDDDDDDGWSGCKYEKMIKASTSVIPACMGCLVEVLVQRFVEELGQLKQQGNIKQHIKPVF